MTVVFTDVVGSTALGERLDPESLRSVMLRYFDAVQSTLERHGGTVEKFIGDAVMAVFGVPAVREDDALRAVRAAFETTQALDRLNLALEAGHGIRIVTRTGVNSGDVVVGGGTGDQKLATGDAVNVAARLEQAAATRRGATWRENVRGGPGLRRREARGAGGSQGQERRPSRRGASSASARTFPRSRGRSQARSSAARASSRS